jgi:hypothetical protein
MTHEDKPQEKPASPGDGKIFDGSKWIDIAPSMEVHAMLRLHKQNENIIAERDALKTRADSLEASLAVAVGALKQISADKTKTIASRGNSRRSPRQNPTRRRREEMTKPRCFVCVVKRNKDGTMTCVNCNALMCTLPEQEEKPVRLTYKDNPYTEEKLKKVAASPISHSYFGDRISFNEVLAPECAYTDESNGQINVIKDIGEKSNALSKV